MVFSADSLKSRLADKSPRRYGIYPTPFHRLDRLSSASGRDVWIKRDDLISVGVGGNKVRKLGYLVADALAHGADHLVSVGADTQTTPFLTRLRRASHRVNVIESGGG
jgi:1-aminocyclopropane-1-carboxylate deaminase/D-cysteine desulfhydrase-like pyridoxal-dependent ACC family enzyme